MSKNHNATGRSEKVPRHVRLYHWVIDSAAWKDLSPAARALYVELARFYAGHGTTNGKIALSIRRAAELLNIGKTAAAEAFRELEGHGFIALTKRGGFSRKDKHASEWRLTEFPCDATGELATKEFARWVPQKQNAVPHSGLTVPHGGPHGPFLRTAAA